MAEKFRFFDPVMDEHGNYDREYNAQEFVEYFSALVTTGVMKGAGNQLTVTADNASMVTTLDTGIAFILGRYYENDTPLQHIHDTETVGKQRIDRIVIRMDNNAGSRYVRSFVKKGIASTAPIAPALVRDGEVYEISVAQVRVVGGQTFIRTENVKDERGTDIVCPFAGSRILPNFDDAALSDLINSIGQPSGIAELNADGKVIDAGGNLVEGKVKSVNGMVGDVVVVEKGSNANGEYIKFADGTLICTIKNQYAYQTINSSNDGSKLGTQYPWVYPHTFSSTPYALATIDYGGTPLTADIKNVNYVTTFTKNNTQCNIILVGSHGTSIDIKVVGFAIGRWK